jgi:hypothetical protein
MALLVRQDDDEPANSFVFWAILALCLIFLVVTVALAVSRLFG